MTQHTIQSLAINRADVHVDHLMHQNQFESFFRPSDASADTDDAIHASMTVVLGRVTADVGIILTGDIEAARSYQLTSEIEFTVLPELLLEKIFGDIDIGGFTHVVD